MSDNNFWSVSPSTISPRATIGKEERKNTSITKFNTEIAQIGQCNLGGVAQDSVRKLRPAFSIGKEIRTAYKDVRAKKDAPGPSSYAPYRANASEAHKHK